jgi:hypothetical protein
MKFGARFICFLQFNNLSKKHAYRSYLILLKQARRDQFKTIENNKKHMDSTRRGRYAA